VILAWGHLWAQGVGEIDRLEDVAWSATQRLVECYNRSMRPDWRWFESRMTYANAVLPHALFVAARRWQGNRLLEVAESSFAFLDRETTAEDIFWPVGNDDWYPHGEDKALYDQQPVEAATMADAALAGFDLLDDEKYRWTFHKAHAWFHGGNSLRHPLVDAACGACCDGLQSSGLNRNQGAESTLAYLWTELRNAELESSLQGSDAASPEGVPRP
jgi:hypothetical protein